VGCSAQTSPNLGLGKRARRSTVEAAYRFDWATNVLVLVFHNLMFVDTGKRWLRALWNCELRSALAAGFLVRVISLQSGLNWGI
jgi:hypothetical protein